MKTTTMVAILVLFLGMALTALFLFFRRRNHQKLNRVIGGTNEFGDQNKYFKWRQRLYVSSIIGFDVAKHLKALSEHFLSRGESYNFVVPSGWLMTAFNFRLCCVKTLSVIANPKRSKKALRSPFLPIGRTLLGKEVNLTLSNTSLCLIVGSMGSGKSRLGYLLLDSLSNKTWRKTIYVVDLTSTFPRRICEKGNAKRITTHEALLSLAKDLTEENEKRQALLNRFDVDHYKNLPKEYEGLSPIFIVIDEAYSLFENSQDLKSEQGKQIVETARLFNEIISTGRKTGFGIIVLSISGLKSQNLLRLGNASIILSGFLPASESEAILQNKSANNPALRSGIFVIKSQDFLEPTIFQSYQYDDKDLKNPKDMGEEKPPTV